METTLRVAIAGCHRMLLTKLTNHNFAAAFDAVSETEMVAVFDRGADARMEFCTVWGQMPTYADYEQMLAEVKPDIVCIATRQTTHADMVEQATEAGVRGILCDKPLATSLAEADRIAAACREHHVALQFALDRRHQQPYLHLRQLIAGGIVGDVKSMIAYGLPNLINHGCHWYDTVLMLLSDPEPVWVSGLVDDVSADPLDSRRHLDPPGRGQVGLDNGVVAYFTPDGGKGPAFDIVGTGGRLWIGNDAHDAYLWSMHDGSTGNPLSRLELPSHAENWPAGPAMVRDLVNAIRSNSPTACDVTDARRATEIGFAFHLSHRADGARIALPAINRTLCIPSFPWGNE